MSFNIIRENKMLAKISEFTILEEKVRKLKKKKKKDNDKGATLRLNSLRLFQRNVAPGCFKTNCRIRRSV